MYRILTYIYVGLQQKDVLKVLELTGLNCPSIIQKGNAIIDAGFPTHQPLQHMQVHFLTRVRGKKTYSGLDLISRKSRSIWEVGSI